VEEGIHVGHNQHLGTSGREVVVETEDESVCCDEGEEEQEVDVEVVVVVQDAPLRSAQVSWYA